MYYKNNKLKSYLTVLEYCGEFNISPRGSEDGSVRKVLVAQAGTSEFEP